MNKEYITPLMNNIKVCRITFIYRLFFDKMGYTHTDCVVCYLSGYGNKKAPIRQVCPVCIENVYEEEGSDGFGNVQTVCMSNFAGEGVCERCRHERIFLFSIGLCNNDILDSDDDEEDFDGEDYEEEDEREYGSDERQDDNSDD